jgi:SAM-dependent methyltransferase
VNSLVAERRLSRQFVKLCEREDFEDPALTRMIDELVPGLSPVEQLHRKYWELAMLSLYLEEAGALREDAAALSVAAGREPSLYWMANRVGRMVATDIYGQGAFGGREADSSMLTDPSVWAPYTYREDHLEVYDMNALALDFPDESFDIVFSLSSIEHFGGTRAAAQAAREMSRVLRPGAHLVITTECLLGHHVLDRASVQFAIRLATRGRRCGQATPHRRATEVFTRREIEQHIIQASGLHLVQPLDAHVSSGSYENLIRMTGSGEPSAASGEPYPHIVLKAYGAPWTSAFLALHKHS